MKPIVIRFQKFLEHKNMDVPALIAHIKQEGHIPNTDSGEKIYRLFRKPGAMPSIELLTIFSNVFDDLDLNWLIHGTGHMLKTGKPSNHKGRKDSHQVATGPDTPYGLPELDDWIRKTEARLLALEIAVTSGKKTTQTPHPKDLL